MKLRQPPTLGGAKSSRDINLKDEPLQEQLLRRLISGDVFLYRN